MSRPCITLIVTALMCLLCMQAMAAETPPPAAPAPSPVALENEFIRVVVNPGPNEAGRFSITTTGGDPSRPQSKNKRLIFGGNKPWTSYTTVRIDGTPYVVGGPTQRRAGLGVANGKTLQAPTLAENRILYRQEFGDIELTQEIGFVRGMSTRMLDTAGITYMITNRGTAPRKVGLRMLLDTMCGDNDGAPIRAGRQAITTATLIKGKDVPDFWQAFDNLASPTVISQGSMRGAGITPPDALLFADWGTFADDPWEPTLTPGEGFIRKGESDPDTALAMIWNPVTIAPGQTITRVSHYGIGEVSLKPGQLTLGLTAPAETKFEHERTQSFTLTGYLQNVGGFAARDVTMTLHVPKGLTVTGGDTVKDTEKLLKPNDTMQKSWNITPTGEVSGKVTLTLTVTSGNIEGNEITREIQVEVPTPRTTFKPSTHRVQVYQNEAVPVVMELNMSPADQFSGARVTVAFDPQVIRPLDISRGRAFLDSGKRYYWRVDKSQVTKGLLTFTGRRIDTENVAAAPLTQAEVNLATLQFRTIKPGKCALTLVNAVLIDAKGEERPMECIQGEVEVIGDSAK